MRRFARALLALAAIVVTPLAAWRIYGLMQAERNASVAPDVALQWRPADPQALLALGEAQLLGGNPNRAADTARRLLAREPLAGQGFRVLGQAANRLGEPRQSLRYFQLAVHHAPRDIPARAGLFEHYLQAGDYRKALVHIDYVLRTTPGRDRAVSGILRQLAPMAQDPRFADALIEALLATPPWRGEMVRYLGAYPDVMATLNERNALTSEERGRWLDGLMASGNWGEAYARWASFAVAHGETIPLLWNGAFTRQPDGIGFDWRLDDQKGVLGRFEPQGRGNGVLAHLQFVDAPILDTGLSHALLLFPGKYRFSARMRAQAVQGEVGLTWRIECGGGAGVIARGEPIHGTFAWRESSFDFQVPATGCPGQWLRLVNGVESGLPGRIAGEVWVDDAQIRPVAAPPQS